MEDDKDISRSKSKKNSATKFYNSLRNLKSQFKQIYKRCTCNGLNTFTKSNSSKLYNEQHKVIESIQSQSSISNVISQNSSHKQIQDNLQFNESHWLVNREKNVGYLLPSPPPTPRDEICKEDPGKEDGDGDCDFFKVISPPPLFQDRSTLSSYKKRQRQSNSRLSSAFQNNICSHFIGVGDIAHTISESLITNRDQDNQFKLTNPTLRSYSTYSNLIAVSKGNRDYHQKSRNVGKTDKPNSMTCLQLKSPSQKYLPRLSYINWKDLPKCISLHVDNGYEAMFIPSWTNQLTKRAPCFPIVEKIVNFTQIEKTHERVVMRKRRQLEIQQEKFSLINNLWFNRLQVGLKYRKLLIQNRVEVANIQEDISTRFQFMHWLTESYDDSNSIGRFFDIQEKRLVAIKIAENKASNCVLKKVKLKLGAVNEISSLIQMDHVNIVQIFTYFNLTGKMHVVLEACDHSLRCEILCASKGIHAKMAHGVIYQIINGIAHCHKLDCLHRDLCPENILVTVEGVVKVANFSKSIFLRSRNKLAKDPVGPGNIAYGAPELLALDPQFEIFSDIWSIGCVLIELLRGRVLWDGESPQEQLILINQTVGPLLSRHSASLSLTDEGEMSKNLNDHLPTVFDDVMSFIKKCLEVDPKKRSTCQELLEHCYMKRGSSIPFENFGSVKTPEDMLPRMALWELRPHTAPTITFAQNNNTISTSVSSNSVGGQSGQVSPEISVPVCDNKENENPSPSILRTKTAVISKKSNASILFSAKPVMINRPNFEPNFMSTRVTCASQHIPIYDHKFSGEQFYGFGHKSLWNLHDINIKSPRALSKSMQEASSIPIKKGKMMDSRKVSSTDVNCYNGMELFENHPVNSRARMQHIINVLPAANWNTVQMFTTQLQQTAKKNPKTFSAQLNALTTALLDQITKSPKVSGPAIRILNNICKSKGKYFESEAERIMESMLNKLGGPSFIEKEGNEVLRHLVKALKPIKAITALIKFGSRHKTSAARLSSILLIEESLKNLDLISAFGLPGEQTGSQRKLSSAVFHMATRSLRDSNAHTRIAARDIYQQLMTHPGFWYLYQTSVPEENRQWVNRLLDEILKSQDGDKKNIKPIFLKNPFIV